MPNQPADPATSQMMLMYLGRRGAMPQFMLDALRAAGDTPGLVLHALVSRQNENYAAYDVFGDRVIGIDTFGHASGALLSAWRIPGIRRTLASQISRLRIDTVIDLMPHVWSPLLLPTIRHAGARYIAIAHDAEAHPGDATGRVKGFIDRALMQADGVIALSGTVANRLQNSGRLPADRIHTLFLPDFAYGATPLLPHVREADAPLRLLFLGRILPYKGLGLFLAAVEAVRASGIPVEIGVFGEGALGADASRLEALGAEVINRWLSDTEISQILPRYDVTVVSHVEASQSGAVATGFGAGLPILATPVGGLPEQVEHGVTGLVAKAATAAALAVEIRRLCQDRNLHALLRDGVANAREQRSMTRFVRELGRIARRPAA